MQEFDGKVALKGPAFPERSGAGMSMGGGMWPTRYVNYCGGKVEAFAEDEVSYYSNWAVLHTCYHSNRAVLHTSYLGN